MKLCGIHEGLAFKPANVGPKVSIFLSTQTLQSQPEALNSLKNKAVAEACKLVNKNYSSVFVSYLERSLKQGLNDAVNADSRGVQSLALLWSVSETKAVKLPVAVTNHVVASENFHVKPLFEAREKNGDFISIATFGSRLEVFLVRATRLEQILTMPFQESSEELITFNQNASHQLLEAVLRARTNRNTPILIVGSKMLIDYAMTALQHINCFKQAVSINDFRGRGADFFSSTRAVMEPYFRQIQLRSIFRLNVAYLIGGGVRGLESVGTALAEDQVKEIFVAQDHCIWGHYDPDRGIIHRHSKQLDSNDEDVLNRMILAADSKNILVHIVPSSLLPDRAMTAAILKSYPRQAMVAGFTPSLLSNQPTQNVAGAVAS